MKKWSEIWADIRKNEDSSDFNRGMLKDVLNGNFLQHSFMRRQAVLFFCSSHFLPLFILIIVIVTKSSRRVFLNCKTNFVMLGTNP